MKRKLLHWRWLAVVTTLTVLTYACRKDINAQIGQTSANSTTTFSISQAKSYLDSALNSSTSGSIKLQSIDPAQQYNTSGFVYWKRARTLNAQRFNVVEIPLIINKKKINLYDFAKDSVKIKPDASVAQAAFSRIIIYQDGNTKSINKEIITYLPDKSYLTAHKNDASGNWLDNIASDFSGYLEYKNWNGVPMYVLRIAKGKRVARYNLTIIKTGSTTKPQVQDTFLDCTDYDVPAYYTVCSQDSEGNLYDCDTEMTGDYDIIEICVEVDIPGPQPPLPDPQPPTPPPTDPSSGSTPPPPSTGCPITQSIVNGKLILSTEDCDIRDSLAAYRCAQSVVQSIPNLKGQIASLINTTFGKNEGSLNLIFRASTTLTGTEDGETDNHLSTLQLNGGTISGDLVIDLNATTLTTATNEYILATLYHEALHGYLFIMKKELGTAAFNTQFPAISTYTDPTSGKTYDVLDLHSQMAANFLTPLQNAIKLMNPNLTDAYALEIAEGGIINDPNILPANNAERAGTTDAKGTKCSH
jgi:hypothetical protein